MARQTKKKKILKSIKSHPFRFAFIIAGIVAVIVIVVFSTFHGKEKITNKYLEGILQKSSDLTTAKFKYTGWTKYEDDGIIPFVTKGGFIMVYKATASAGITLSDVDVDVNNVDKTILLTIPKAEISGVYVDPSTIQYFDEKFKLLNFSQKEDANKAQALAEEEAKKEISEMGILEMADEQSAALVKGLLANVAKDYTFEVKYVETEDTEK